jgi:hypothetical protein
MKYTHTGAVFGVDARTPPGYNYTVRLRETKNFWIDHKKRKYSKRLDGLEPCDWPLCKLDIESIKEIENEN